MTHRLEIVPDPTGDLVYDFGVFPGEFEGIRYARYAAVLGFGLGIYPMPVCPASGTAEKYLLPPEAPDHRAKRDSHRLPNKSTKEAFCTLAGPSFVSLGIILELPEFRVLRPVAAFVNMDGFAINPPATAMKVFHLDCHDFLFGKCHSQR